MSHSLAAGGHRKATSNVTCRGHADWTFTVSHIGCSVSPRSAGFKLKSALLWDHGAQEAGENCCAHISVLSSCPAGPNPPPHPKKPSNFTLHEELIRGVMGEFGTYPLLCGGFFFFGRDVWWLSWISPRMDPKLRPAVPSCLPVPSRLFRLVLIKWEAADARTPPRALSAAVSPLGPTGYYAAGKKSSLGEPLLKINGGLTLRLGVPGSVLRGRVPPPGDMVGHGRPRSVRGDSSQGLTCTSETPIFQFIMK